MNYPTIVIFRELGPVTCSSSELFLKSYFSLNMIRERIELRRMNWTRYVACMVNKEMHIEF
jgi:hypothetical protein